MKVFNRLVLLAAAAMFAGSAFAQSEESNAVSPEIAAQVLKSLKAARPGMKFGMPKASPVPGYYEVQVPGSQIIYVSENGGHFFAGELYFPEAGRFVNATEVARTKTRLTKLAELNEDDMIIFSPEGETKASMIVFTDVTCGYCKKLHQQIDEINELGIEVRYMAYPRSGIKRNGQYTREYNETVKAWCSQDPHKTMTALKHGAPVPEKPCDDNPVAEHYEIGSQFGVTGTPAIILPDGTLISGYMSPRKYADILGL